MRYLPSYMPSQTLNIGSPVLTILRQIFAYSPLATINVPIYFFKTNGLKDRFNQTLSRCLAKVIDDDQCNWDEKIDTVLMGYCASRQASTKYSPILCFTNKI